MSAIQERRGHVRAEIRWPIVLLTNRGAIVGETINIGVNGAFIFCQEPLQEKEQLRLFIMAPDRQPLSLPVEVTWSNPHPSAVDFPPRGMGVRFKEISDQDQKFISKLVAGVANKEIRNIPYD